MPFALFPVMVEDCIMEPPEASTTLPLGPTSASLKRKREDIVETAPVAVSAPASTSTPGTLRFKEGTRVVCNLSKRSRGFLWKAGMITAVSHEVDGSVVPYVVEVDDGQLAASPEDDDEAIRLAARAHLDTRVMRVFAVSSAVRAVTRLRFMEGDRVAVQLDLGMWEEGAVLEVWTKPERNGKPFKTWVGVAVPYAVRLDLGDDVMVPFDTDEVIRAESAARPPQKSIAEQLGGTALTTGGKRFVRLQNAAGEWSLRDTTTGVQRPCKPPDSDDED